MALMSADMAEVGGIVFPSEWARLFRRASVLADWPGRRPDGKGEPFA